jgi:hypothetical protein
LIVISTVPRMDMSNQRGRSVTMARTTVNEFEDRFITEICRKKCAI